MTDASSSQESPAEVESDGFAASADVAALTDPAAAYPAPETAYAAPEPAYVAPAPAPAAPQTRPEVGVAGAFAGGLVLALILKRLAR